MLMRVHFWELRFFRCIYFNWHILLLYRGYGQHGSWVNQGKGHDRRGDIQAYIQRHQQDMWVEFIYSDTFYRIPMFLLQDICEKH